MPSDRKSLKAGWRRSAALPLGLLLLALALGWHVYALLLPFIAFSLASELISTHCAAAASSASPFSKIKRFSAVLLLGRPFALGLTALAFGLLALSFNRRRNCICDLNLDLHMRKLSGERPMARFAVAALLVLVFSNWQMNRVDQEDAAGRAFHTEEMSDFQAIRSQTAGGAIAKASAGQFDERGPIWWVDSPLTR